MRLSWNEVRARASSFAKKWKDASREKSETQSFYNDFFEVFGVARKTVARYEVHVSKLDNSTGFIDLFWPGVLMVEQKSAGRDLSKAYDQAGEYFDALPEYERPSFIMVSDFKTFELHDLEERECVTFLLEEFSANVERFGFVLGMQKKKFCEQDPVNIKAAELMGRLHDKLAASGHYGHDLERFLMRIVFCMFADDTGVFERRDVFLDLIETRTSEDGADMGQWLAILFEVLNTPEDKRPTTLDEDLDRFPYINGDLFRGNLRFFSFDKAMRDALLNACRFDWSNISPAIFGALFQSVIDSRERRTMGAHYTTEKNILKVIEPLFMDDLRSQFERLRKRRDTRRLSELRKFHSKLGSLTFFDPACGCGNFLIIAYRELRLLEIEVIREILDANAAAGQKALDVKWQSVVDVNQFYGIEIGEFPARIAEAALWMMDHIMNNRLSLEFGQTFVRIPLENSPHIMHADALETDWSDLLPPHNCSFILGNPPFAGAKYQTVEQRAQVRKIAALCRIGGTLDYVAAWLIKAGEYVKEGNARIGFVATNSITQGEQVAQLWPVLFERYKLEISFAHRTFLWGSDARGPASVHVVIIGLDRRESVCAKRRLFTYPKISGDPEEGQYAAISPYLFDAGGMANPRLVVKRESSAINGLAKLIIGSKPIDGGNYIFNESQRREFLENEPDAEDLLRPFAGTREFLQGEKRWILALHDASPERLSNLPQVRQRIAKVRAYRNASNSEQTRILAKTPSLYHVNVIPKTPFLVIPEVNSERRQYVPIGWLEPPIVPSNLVKVLENATLADFALLTSAIHMTWLRYIGGRLASSYRYSIGLVYNTFPLPPNRAKLSGLEVYAQAVLEARAKHADANLSALYDPDLMPPNLMKAHRSLDRAVDRLYRPKGFKSEHERMEHLLKLYEEIKTPLDALAKKKTKRR
ncbi:MAG: hypothetical protein OXC66_03140 [Roseovarius sp.]|nr:hypothetical protein [Roseovarius sp.]